MSNAAQAVTADQLFTYADGERHGLMERRVTVHYPDRSAGAVAGDDPGVTLTAHHGSTEYTEVARNSGVSTGFS